MMLLRKLSGDGWMVHPSPSNTGDFLSRIGGVLKTVFQFMVPCGILPRGADGVTCPAPLHGPTSASGQQVSTTIISIACVLNLSVFAWCGFCVFVCMGRGG